MSSPRGPAFAVVETFVEGLIAGATLSTAAQQGAQPAFQQGGSSPAVAIRVNLRRRWRRLVDHNSYSVFWCGADSCTSRWSVVPALIRCQPKRRV
jgi:hypothetical protein